MDSLASLQDTWKMVDGTSLACIIFSFSFSFGDSLWKIILQGGTTRKDSYLAITSSYRPVVIRDLPYSS